MVLFAKKPLRLLCLPPAPGSKKWILFFIAILIVSSIHFTVLAIFFNGSISYGALMSTAFFSFLIYPAVAKLFNQIYLLGLKQENVE